MSRRDELNAELESVEEQIRALQDQRAEDRSVLGDTERDLEDLMARKQAIEAELG